MLPIQFDFHTVKMQEECTREVRTLLEELICGEYADTMQSLKTAWEGETAAKFQNKLRHQEERMRHTSALLEKARTKMEEAYRRMEAAECAAEEISEKRTYK